MTASLGHQGIRGERLNLQREQAKVGLYSGAKEVPVWIRIVSSFLLPLLLLALGILMTPEMIAASPSEGRFCFTVVYDNYGALPGLTTGWGFGCVLETPAKTILFDTGGDGSVLLSNMEKLNISPQDIDIVVISHIHADHLGGLGRFLGKNKDVEVYIPASFPISIEEDIRSFGAECHRVGKVTRIARNVFSTGEMGIGIKEQSLVCDTMRGLIVITGCAHPGIVSIIKRAKEICPGRDVHLAMGGFHLGGASDSKLREIIKEFRNLGVQRTGPCHCSGNRCRELFKREYQENYVDAGVGRIVTLEHTKDPKASISQ